MGIWELQNIPSSLTTEYEIDVTLLQPKCSQWDRYRTAEPMDLMIYASHEQTIAFAGDWLIEAILVGWPEWRECWHVPVEKG